jgi:TonB family protein
LLLSAVGYGISGARPPAVPQPGLWVRLVGAGRDTFAASGDPEHSSFAISAPAAEPQLPRPRLAAGSPAPQAQPAEPEGSPAPSSQAHAEQPARLANGHVEVSTTTTLARLGEALQGRAQADFLPELAQPVRPASALMLDYPRVALEAGHEGSVLAWVRVASDGSVEEIEIVEGEPEFADSVRDGLTKLHFLPAEADGQAVEHYIILQFDFRIGESRASRAGTTDLGQVPLH